MTTPSAPDFSRHAKHFDEAGFQRLMPRLLVKVGIALVRKALYLYQALVSPDTPLQIKALIVAALGYLVCPFDAIPDVLGPVGFVDDGAVLALCLKMIAQALTPAVVQQAEARLDKLSGRI